MLLGVDVGGTFTDAVVAVSGRLVTAKAPTTPHDQSEGVLAAVRAALERAGGAAAGTSTPSATAPRWPPTRCSKGRGARTVARRDPRASRTSSSSAARRAPTSTGCAPRTPLRSSRPSGGSGRTSGWGPRACSSRSTRTGPSARWSRRSPRPSRSACCTPTAIPEHERALGDAIAAALPGVHVSLSHEVVGTFREFERAATTELDAALSPAAGAYLERLVGRAREAGLPAPSVMQSSGGLADADRAGAHAALTVLSGPAGGGGGRRVAAVAAGEPDALCFDMGGTSCDVCVIQDGSARETGGRPVGGRPVALPMLDLHTVGAGGGSVAWRDAGGALRVGPRSAGARPARPPTATVATSRRSPTRTSSSACSGRTPRSRAPSRSTSTRPARRSGGSRWSSASESRPARSGSAGSRAPRWHGRCG
jgi:N-methylhydantoinase A